MTQKYNLSKYERAAKLVLNAVGITPEKLGFLEKLVRLENDKLRVRKICAGFRVYGNSFLQNAPIRIDIYVNSRRFAYKNYVKNYLKNKRIHFKSGAGLKKFYQRNEGDSEYEIPVTFFFPYDRISVAVSKDRRHRNS